MPKPDLRAIAARPPRRSRILGRRNRPDERGQALVEFAYALVPFVIVLLLIFDFGFLFFSNMTVANATREAVRIGITYRNLDPDEPDLTGAEIALIVRQQVADMSGGLVSPSDVSVTCHQADSDASIDCGIAERLDRMEVTTTYTHFPVTPLFLGSGITLTSTVEMTME